MDTLDPYRMMATFGHAHFRFRFWSRLFFPVFAICSLINDEFLRRLVGTGGVQTFREINGVICPCWGRPGPLTEISLFGIVPLSFDDF